MIRIAHNFAARRLVLICLAVMLLSSCGGGSAENSPTLHPYGIEGTGGLPPPPPPSSLKMTTARAGHTATLLQDGKILIAGGTGNSGGFLALASAELYDPSNGTFTPTGDMTTARTGHSATLLANGKVLIAGGDSGGPGPYTFLVSAEIYDPSTGTFTATGNMTANGGFGWSSSDLLPDGRVLIAAEGNAEVYDPSTGTFALTGAYSSSPTGVVEMQTATLLPDGRVLAIGAVLTQCASGQCIWNAGPAELFDPKTDTFSATDLARASLPPPWPPTVAPPFSATATLLMNGTVLFVDGNDEELADYAAIYDPASGKFTPIGFTQAGHEFGTATGLPDGTVLIAGGQVPGGNGSTAVELYVPATGTFTSTTSMTTGRHEHTATLLHDGTVLIAGGYSTWPNPTASAEIYKK
jgi:hypothetical protein